MIRLLLVSFVTACVAFAGGPTVSYTKSFPGSNPAYMAITVDSDGKATYKEKDDDDPDTIQLEPGVTQSIFDLTNKLDRFNRTIESGLKVANMGAKTFRWEEGAESHEAKFNYSQDENARTLQDLFERISESQRLFLELKRSIRYDKLGVHQALLRIQLLWEQKRLVGSSQLLPLFDRVAKDETFLHMARERAANLADGVRALAK